MFLLLLHPLALASFLGLQNYDYGRLRTIEKALLNGKVTLEAWIKLVDDPSGNQIIVGVENCMQMSLAGGKVLTLSLKTGGFNLNSAPPWNSDWSVPHGVWTWVAASADAMTGLGSLFMQQVAFENAAHASDCYGQREIQLGFGPAMANDYWRRNNLMANVRVWRAALDAATLATVYDKQFPPGALPCDVVSVWPLKQSTAGDATQAALVDVRERFRLTEFYVKKVYGVDPGCGGLSGCTICPWPAQIELDDPPAMSTLFSHPWTTTSCAPFGGASTPPPTPQPSPSPTSAPTKQPSYGAGTACASRSSCEGCMADGACQHCWVYGTGFDSHWECIPYPGSCNALPSQTVTPGENCPTPSPTPLSWATPPPPTCQKPTPMPPQTNAPTPAVSAGEEPWKGAASGELWRKDGEEGEIAGVNSTVFIVLLVVAAVLLIAALSALVIFFVYLSRRRRRRGGQQQQQPPRRSRASTMRRSTHSSLHRASRNSRSYRNSDVIVDTPAYI